MKTQMLLAVGMLFACFEANSYAGDEPFANLSSEGSGQGAKYEIVEYSSACTIFKVTTNNGSTFYNVVAAVGTVFLPEIVYGICKRSVGNPDVCNAVYDVTTALVELKGEKIYRGITGGLQWLASRGKVKSTAAIKTTAYSIASGIKTVFEAYSERCSEGNGIPWQSIEIENPDQIENLEIGPLSQELVDLNEQASRINEVAFAPDGGYVIIYDEYGYVCKNVPVEFAAQIKELNAKQEKITNVAFTPDNGYAIIYGKNGAFYRNIPQGAAEWIKELNAKGEEIAEIEFAPNGGYVIINGDNGYAYYNIPQDAVESIKKLNATGQKIKEVAFTPYGGYVIIFGSNGYFYNGIDQNAGSRINELNSRQDKISVVSFNNVGGYVIIFEDNGYWHNIE